MNEPLRFAIIGDSAASGVGDSDSLGNYFGWGYHLAQAFTEPLIYINASRPGAQSKEVLHEQLPKISIHNPELVAVIVGGNDLLRNGFSPQVFEDNLNETLALIEMMGATSMLLELHDPTRIVPMPRLVARVCRRRVNAVNRSTRKLARRYSSVLLETRSLDGIYQREKWHVDRMHPSKLGHQFIADNFAHLLRKRGFEIGNVQFSASNNRSRKDSIIWMLKNGTPWFLKRSLDLLPAILFLSITELIHIARYGRDSESAEVFFPEFAPQQMSHKHLQKERVS
ncbi:SGNH/GDSL hydrolase family protein [Actinobacteria bacterium IMCC25003]|nr:SGNH/GDSL hydrolase family protein [Actinobacteria bacterium IMCC25003]